MAKYGIGDNTVYAYQTLYKRSIGETVIPRKSPEKLPKVRAMALATVPRDSGIEDELRRALGEAEDKITALQKVVLVLGHQL